MKNKPAKNLIGQKFGKLIVIDFVGFKTFWKDRRESYWKVKCECGVEKELRIGHLKNTKSCGCLLANFRKNILPQKTTKRNTKPYGEAAKHTCFSSYVQRAKKKNIDFEFSKEQFIELTQNNCYYCGRKPRTTIGLITGKTKKRNRNGEFIYNGIDRVDSSKGYTKDNCVTCCEICNKAKRDLSQIEFLQWIEDLIKYRKIK